MRTSYLPRRSLLNAFAAVSTGSRSRSVEQRVERRLVVVAAGEEQRPGPRRFGRQLLDPDVPELHQARRPGPLAPHVLRAVMLEGEAAPLGEVGDRGARDDGHAVQDDRDRLTPRRDLEMVPLAHRPVSLVPGGDGGAEVGRGVAAGPHGVHLARADGPAPDVDLVIAVAAEEDAGVGVGQRELQFFAVDVLRVRAVGQDVRDVLVDERRLLEPPVQPQHEVAVLPLGPQVLVARGFAAGVVVDHAVDDLPVPVVAVGHLPAGEVLAVEQGDEALRLRIVARRGQRGGEQGGGKGDEAQGRMADVLDDGWPGCRPVMPLGYAKEKGHAGACPTRSG